LREWRNLILFIAKIRANDEIEITRSNPKSTPPSAAVPDVPSTPELTILTALRHTTVVSNGNVILRELYGET
jgi:hypothetical protein